MIVFTSLLLASLASHLVAAPGSKPGPPGPAVLSIKAAKAMGAGATVTVRGVISNGPELGALRFVQDTQAGLALYALPTRVPGYDELRAGDSLQVTGQLKSYNGLLEMDPITTVRKISSGNKVRALKVPMKDLGSAYVEANEGRLLEITGVSKLTTPAGAPVETLSANANFLLDGDKAAALRVTNASTGPTGIIDAAVPKGESFDVRGILSQFSPSGTGGYQLLPRLSSDLMRGGGLPRITAEPVPVGTTPQSFTLEYTTLYPGDTRLKFGPSATQLTEERVAEGFSTQHRITVEGLQPGTTYYVQVASRNAAGTATSTAVPIITGGKKKRS
ncbi:MAG: fibronectin type III domain-containing protein [Janthinobacterium lividum]